LFILLLIVVLIVWGIILFRLISYFYGDEEPQVEIVKEVIPENIFSNKSKANDIELAYVKLDKDPFVLTRVKKVVKKRMNNPVKDEPKEQLNFVVNGVLINDKSKTVLIVDQTNNETVFLKEGADYKSIKILSISPSEIKISEFNKTKILSVSN